MSDEDLKERRKRYTKTYRDKKLAKDPDYYNRKARAYREKNREKVREYMKEYMRKYFEDPDNYAKQVEYTLNWYNTHRRKKKNVQAEE